MISDVALERVSSDHPLLWKSVTKLLYRQLADAMQRVGDLLVLPPKELILTRPRTFAYQKRARIPAV